MKVINFFLVLLVFVYLVLGFLAFGAFKDFEYALPFEYEVGQFLGVDSWRYMVFSYGVDDFFEYIASIFSFEDRGLFLTSNLFIYYLGWVSQEVLDLGYGFVYFFNLFVFFSFLFFVREICRFCSLSFSMALVCILVNPLVFLSIFSLNKEILGLWIVASGFCFLLKKSYFSLLGVAVFSLFVKSFFFFFLVGLSLVYFFRVPGFYFLAGFSLVVSVFLNLFGVGYFGGGLQSLSQASEYFSQGSLHYMILAEKLMYYPFGYIFSFFLVFSINLVSPFYSMMGQFVYLLSSSYWFSLGLFFSSVFFCLLVGLGSFFHGWEFFRRFLFSRDGFDPVLVVIMVYVVMMCVLPISQHRYLLPIYPFVCLFFTKGMLYVRSARSNSSF